MDDVSEHDQHKFQSAHQLCLSRMKSFRNIDIPPRKLLTREPSMEMYSHLHQHHDNNNEGYARVFTEDSPFQKFLPNADDDDKSDPYASNEFRMYEFKVRMCTRSRSHDWTDCPFTHPGEKARRRCPRRYVYSGEMCPDFRRGYCFRGDNCGFAHGVFEHWLHPSRYRTEACKDGTTCQRKICFFAHSPTQLRSLSSSDIMGYSPIKHVINSGHCASCRCHVSPSPTSILDRHNDMSPPTSPFSPISRFSNRLVRTGSGGMTHVGYKELMHNMQAMKLNASDQGPSNLNRVWMDSLAVCNDEPRLLYSPSGSASGSSRVRVEENYAVSDVNEVGFGNPDLEWVNDLLS